MKNHYLFFVLLWLMSPMYGTASHQVGGFIQYEAVQDSVFDVTVTFYRNCRGVSASNPSNATKLKCSSSSTSQNISLTLVSIKEITRICPSVTPGCNPKNTYGTGDGWEEHIYSTTIDFRAAPYQSMLGCSQLYFEVNLSGRPADINTGSANETLILLTTLDPSIYASNSSPVFRDKPRFRYCCNRSYYLDNGADDPDGDSLSYALISPKTGYSTSASWNTGYSASTPVKVYNPGGSGTTNPNTIPPRGFYIDPTDGFTVFTATNCGDISPMVVEVTEWRKDTAGAYQKVGITIRENLMVVGQCLDNNLPQLDLNASYSVCEGDSFELNIQSSDQVYTPPPPAPKPDPDTVRISVFSSIPGYSFSTDNDTSLFQSGTFAWQPDSGMARSTPYRFTVVATDNNCPFPGTYMRRVNLFVRQKPKSIFKREQISCGTYSIDGTQIKETTSKVTYRILDSAGKVIQDTANHRFVRSGGTHSTYLDDTLVFYKQGIFVIEQSSDNDACITYQYDTLFTSGKVELLPQTNEEICATSFNTYSISFIGEERIKSVFWEFGSATSDSSSITFNLSSGSKLLRVNVVTLDGCRHLDSTELMAVQIPKINPLRDTVICSLDSTIFTLTDTNNPGYKNTTYLWSTNDSVSALAIQSSNPYWGEIRNFCGFDRDSFMVQCDSLFGIDLGADQYACDLDSLFIGDVQSIQGVQYQWNTNEKGSGIYATQTGRYNLVAKNSCMVLSDSIYLFFDHTPTIQWLDTSFYCDQVSDTLRVSHPGATFQWSDNSTADSLIISEPGPYSVIIHPKACKNHSVNTFAKIITTPVVNIGNDTLLKRPFTIVLNAYHQDATYLWSTGSTQSSVNIHNFGTYWVRVTNSCGTVSDTITLKDLVGVQELNGLRYTIFPNPNSGTFHLQGEVNQLNLTLTNQLGQEVPFIGENEDGGLAIQLVDVAPGIYYLICHLPHQVARFPILVD
ncbi:MAG: hypothetical protein H6608_11175 [Flavobacteriales bacterium]|nr:hypothetical protein [Flavobacteriales bacterium]